MSVKVKLMQLLSLVLTIAFCVANAVPVYAQETTVTRTSLDQVVSPTTGTIFRIGCLRSEPDTRITLPLVEALREHLLATPAVQEAMAEAQVSHMEVRSFDAHRWLMEAMDAEQVDLAFCSSIDYIYQRGNYVPIFQLRLPFDRPGRGRLYHYGSIFVNNRSPLFALDRTAALQALPQYLRQKEVALVGPNSASGYVYPLLKLSELTTSTELPWQTRFWGSSEEVVKAVVNGAAEVGACDAGALDEVLKKYNLFDKRDLLVREIARTSRLPRDPVVLLARWSPERSELGRAISIAARQFFDAQAPELPRLEPSTDTQPFNELRGSLTRFNQLRSPQPGR